MKCIILAAGYGTRLYPLTRETAKPLLPIRGKPIIEHIIHKVEALDCVDEACIVVNDRFYGDFKNWLDSFSNTVPVTVINDGSKNHKDKRGAIGDFAFAVKERLIDDDTLLIGGDNLFSFSLSDFVNRSREMAPNPLIGIYDLNGKTRANKYGVVQLDKEGRVITFLEKPRKLNGSRLVSLCLYFIPKEALSTLDAYLSTDNDTDSIGNYIKWLSRNKKVYGFNFNGSWFDVGDMESYTDAVYTF